MATSYLQPYACPICAALITPRDYHSLRYSTPAFLQVDNATDVLHSITARAGLWDLELNILKCTFKYNHQLHC